MKPQAVQILVPRALSGISIDIRAATDGSAIRASHSQREDAPTVHRSRETCRAEIGDGGEADHRLAQPRAPP